VAKRRQYFKDYVLVDLAVANAFASEVFDRELLRMGIRPIQVGVLALIHLHGPITPTELEQRTGFAQSTMRERVQGLIDAGYVERRPNESDRRSHYLDTTAAGDDFLRAATPAARAAEKALEERSGVDMDELQRRLVRLRDAGQALLGEVADIKPTLRSAASR
jgi:DNA-binding MarR family transcriptional regulator